MDLKELPSSVMDRVMKRQPMAINHIRKKVAGLPYLIHETKILSKSSESGASSPVGLNQTDLFEDPIPINHYMSKKTDEKTPIEVNPSSPMYPWVKTTSSEKKDTPVKKMRIQQKRTSLSDSATAVGINGKSSSRGLSWSNTNGKEATDDKENNLSTNCSMESSELDHDEDGLLSQGEEQLPGCSTTTGKDDDSSLNSKLNFPSFSTWAKDQQ